MRTRPLAIIGSLLMMLALLPPGSVARAEHVVGALDVCCAWNATLDDGLSYSISGGSQADRDTVAAAVEAWETAVGGGLVLNPVAAGTGEDIKITLKKGGGVIAGLAKRNFDRSGFMKSATISVSLKAFGAANDQAIIGEVTRHEVGHALGLGHADEACDDLMNPTVGGNSAISSADVAGVKAAQHWKLVDGGTAPHKPHVPTVGCP